MSAEPATTAEPAATIPCPRCGAPVGPEQDWCLACGAAARTRLVPTPNWRGPLAVLGVIAVLAGLALAVAFVELTRDEAPVSRTTAPAPAATTPTTAPVPTDTTPTAPSPTDTTPTTATPTDTTPATPTTSTDTTPTTPGATTPAPGEGGQD